MPPLRVWLVGAEGRLAVIAAALRARGLDPAPATPADSPARGPVVVDLDDPAALAWLERAPAAVRPRLGWLSAGAPLARAVDLDFVLPPEPAAAACAAAGWLADAGPCAAAVRRWCRRLAAVPTLEATLVQIAEAALELPGVTGALAAALRFRGGTATPAGPEGPTPATTSAPGSAGEGSPGPQAAAGGSVVERAAVVAAAAGSAVVRLPTATARLAAATALLAGQPPADIGGGTAARLALGGEGDALLLVLDSEAAAAVPLDTPEAAALAEVAGLALAGARREEALRALATAAELHAQALDQTRTAILTNVSHELRTPLVPIKGYTELILKERVGPINDTQREFLGLVLANVERLVTLIDNLLAYARLGQGAERLAPERLDLREVIREAMAALRPAAAAKRVCFEAALGDAPVTMRGDRQKLMQVFVNILSNAVKFNRSGGRVSIEVSRPHEGAWSAVTVTVTDTGIGIPAAALDRIFDRFYQVDGSFTRQYGGAGLGLSIVKDLVTLHGGKVQVSSAEGEGTTVVLSLPRAPRPPGAGRRR